MLSCLSLIWALETFAARKARLLKNQHPKYQMNISATQYRVNLSTFRCLLLINLKDTENIRSPERTLDVFLAICRLSLILAGRGQYKWTGESIETDTVASGNVLPYIFSHRRCTYFYSNGTCLMSRANCHLSSGHLKCKNYRQVGYPWKKSIVFYILKSGT